MNRTELSCLKEVSRIFEQNREEILANWLSLVLKNYPQLHGGEVEMFRTAFTALLDDYIECIGNEDLGNYVRRNETIAQMLAYNDVPYGKMVEIFHLFEESYFALLFELLGRDRIIEALVCLDDLHHRTITIISEKYFEVADNTILSLAKLVELRDNETGGHLERTRGIAAILARGLGQEEHFVDQLFRVAPLHDIGKVGIPDRILLKPGPLTPQEFDEMKQHTVIGARAVEQIIGRQQVSRGHLLMAKELALHHHERYDGTGYPEGLAGSDIPLSARIFSLADVYDAIVSRRPYKEAVPHAEAVEQIRKGVGTQFDPAVISVFLAIHEECRAIHKQISVRELGVPAAT